MNLPETACMISPCILSLSASIMVPRTCYSMNLPKTACMISTCILSLTASMMVPRTCYSMNLPKTACMISTCILSLSAWVKVDGSCCSMTALRLVWLSLSTTWLWKFWSRLAKTSEVSGAAEIPRTFSALDGSGCEGTRTIFRIPNGSVFNQVSGSGSVFGIRIRIQEGKNGPQGWKN
jgi:hypothetical protein